MSDKYLEASRNKALDIGTAWNLLEEASEEIVRLRASKAELLSALYALRGTGYFECLHPENGHKEGCVRCFLNLVIANAEKEKEP